MERDPATVDVSFVIVSWNASRYLLACIESIYANVRGFDYEVVVIDNGSSDGSPEAVRRRFPGVRLVINEGNEGFARGNNNGMTRARGRYICLANSDTVLPDDSIGSLFRFMEGHPDVGLAGPAVVNPDLSFQPSCRKFPSLWDYATECLGLHAVFGRSAVFGGKFLRSQSQPQEVPRAAEILSGCFLFARRSAVDRVGMFDERFYIYGEDVDWSIRFHSAGWGVAYYPLTRVIHHGGASSSRQPLKFSVEMCRSNLLLWDKYHRHSLGLLALILACHHFLRLLGGRLLSLVRPDEQVAFKVKKSMHLLSWIITFLLLARRQP